MPHGPIVSLHHIPSGNLFGAHVLRYGDGRVSMCTNHSRESRALAYSMLLPKEIAYMRFVCGDAMVDEWLAADVVTPREVPESLRGNRYSYDHDFWPIPRRGAVAPGARLPTTRG